MGHNVPFRRSETEHNVPFRRPGSGKLFPIRGHRETGHYVRFVRTRNVQLLDKNSWSETDCGPFAVDNRRPVGDHSGV